MRHSSLLGRREPLEHLELAQPDAVLALQRLVQRAGDPGVAARAAPRHVSTSVGESATVDMARHYTGPEQQLHRQSIARALLAHACIVRRMAPLLLPRTHVTDERWDARTWAALIAAVRRAVPRRPRRLDGRRGAALDPRGPRPDHRAAAVGRLAATCSATAACCCSAAAPPTCSAGAASCIVGAVRLHRRVAARRPGHRSEPAHRARASSRAPAPRSPRPPACPIITTTFAEGPARNQALSVYTAFGASGFSSG